MLNWPSSDRLLTIEDFAGHVGATFRVDALPKAVDLRLDKIERQPANPLKLREPFILLFSTPFAALLTEGHYRMRSPDGRVIGIDLIPTQTPPQPRRAYHAVFT